LTNRRAFQRKVIMTATVTNLCEYRYRKGLVCAHCKKITDEIDYLNKMRDIDSPPFEQADGYDEE
jgi:hypothetical protein